MTSPTEKHLKCGRCLGRSQWEQHEQFEVETNDIIRAVERLLCSNPQWPLIPAQVPVPGVQDLPLEAGSNGVCSARRGKPDNVGVEQPSVIDNLTLGVF